MNNLINMAYNKLNYFKRVKQVQDVFLEHKKDGVTTAYVFNTYIKDRFHIGICTFYKYMAVNARKELKALEEPQGHEHAAA